MCCLRTASCLAMLLQSLTWNASVAASNGGRILHVRVFGRNGMCWRCAEATARVLNFTKQPCLGTSRALTN